MRKIFLLVLSFIPLPSLHADSIYLKTGIIYSNVKIDTTKSVVSINVSGRIDTVKNDQIIFIETQEIKGDAYCIPMTTSQKQYFNKSGANFNVPPITETAKGKPASDQNIDSELRKIDADIKLMEAKKAALTAGSGRTITIKSYPNAPFLAVTGLSALGAYLCFSEASNLSDAIDVVHALFGNRINTDDAEAKKLRYQVLGVACGVVGAWSMVYSLTPVTINISADRMQISYNF